MRSSRRRVVRQQQAARLLHGRREASERRPRKSTFTLCSQAACGKRMRWRRSLFSMARPHPHPLVRSAFSLTRYSMAPLCTTINELVALVMVLFDDQHCDPCSPVAILAQERFSAGPIHQCTFRLSTLPMPQVVGSVKPSEAGRNRGDGSAASGVQ